MNKFIMLSGIPASGKSTTARKILKQNPEIIYVNLDKIHKERVGEYGFNREEDFEIANKMMQEAKKKGKDILFDATNGSYKKRKGILESFRKYETSIIYHIANIETSFRNNQIRVQNGGHHVRDSSLKRHYFMSQVPLKYEADNVIINTFEYKNNETSVWFNEQLNLLIDNPYSWFSINEKMIELYLPELYRLKGHQQYNPYHTMDVYGHTQKVTHNMSSLSQDVRLILSALFHDLGKYESRIFVTKYDDTQYKVLNGLSVLEGNDEVAVLKGLYKNTEPLEVPKSDIDIKGAFYQHENISAKVSYDLAIRLGLTEEDALYISNLSQLHMLMPNEKNDSNKKQWKRFLEKVQDYAEPLSLLREADINGK